MEVLKSFFDLFLVSLAAFLAYQFFNPEPPKKETHHFKGLPMELCKKVEFPHREFEIQLRKGKNPLLTTKSGDFEVPVARLQQYLDHLFFLPQFELKTREESLASYGLTTRPWLRLHFPDFKREMYVGGPVPAKSGLIYFTPHQGLVGQIPAQLKANLLWEAHQFLPRNPFYGLKTLEWKNSLNQTLSYDKSSGFTPSSKRYSRDELLATLSSLELEAFFLPDDWSPDNCSEFASFNGKPLFDCDQHLVSPQRKIYWKHSKVSKERIQNIELIGLSSYLRNHLPPMDIQRIDYSSGVSLRPQDHSFQSVVQILSRTDGQWIKQPEPGSGAGVSLILHFSDGKTLTLYGLHDEILRRLILQIDSAFLSIPSQGVWLKP